MSLYIIERVDLFACDVVASRLYERMHLALYSSSRCAPSLRNEEVGNAALLCSGLKPASSPHPARSSKSLQSELDFRQRSIKNYGDCVYHAMK